MSSGVKTSMMVNKLNDAEDGSSFSPVVMEAWKSYDFRMGPIFSSEELVDQNAANDSIDYM